MDEQEHFHSRERPESYSGRSSTSGSDPLVMSGISVSERSHDSGPSHKGNNDRCLLRRMERSSASPESDRGLDISGSSSFNELVGTSSNSVVTSLLRLGAAWKSSEGSRRQFHCPELPQESRISSLNSFDGFDVPNSRILPEIIHYPCASSSPGCTECPGGSGVQTRPNLNRVVVGQEDLSLDLRQIRPSTGRSVCNPVQQPSQDLHLSLSGSSGNRLGCLFNGLESVGKDLSVSADSSDSRSSQKSVLFQGLRSSGSPSLEIGGVVSDSHSEMPSENGTSSRVVSDSASVRGSDLPQEPRRFPADRMEAIKLGLSLRSKISGPAIPFMLAEHTNSTMGQYQGVWKKFIGFLDEHELLLFSGC